MSKAAAFVVGAGVATVAYSYTCINLWNRAEVASVSLRLVQKRVPGAEPIAHVHASDRNPLANVSETLRDVHEEAEHIILTAVDHSRRAIEMVYKNLR